MDNTYNFTSNKNEIIKGLISSVGTPILRLKNKTSDYLISKGIIKRDPRFNTLREFKDKHLGDRVFIVATGPSLTNKDLEKLKNEYTISMNSIVKMFDKIEFRPTYYVISDGVVYKKIQQASLFLPPERVFIGIGNVKTKWNINVNDVTGTENKNVNFFPVDRIQTLKYLYYKKNDFNTAFSFNADKAVIDGGTITYCAIQLAVYMGFKEIYLLGVDCNYSGKQAHFGETGNSLMERSEMAAAFAAFQQQKAYECAYESLKGTDISIYNATKGGKLEVFKRVDFDSLF